MKPSLLDTDILSEFLRGNPKVITKVDEHLKEYGFINFSIITYYEILNGLLYKDARKQMVRFEELSSIDVCRLLQRLTALVSTVYVP